MLKKITLENFRGFEKHELPLNEFNILVGRNNAGKSTITEALRLLSLVTSRYGNLNFRGVPKGIELPVKYRGVSPSVYAHDFNPVSVYHRLGEPPAVINAYFSNKFRVTIYIYDELKVFAVIYDENGKVVLNKQKALENPLPSVSILPQIGPLSRDEKILTPDYVRQNISTSLSSLHFRNHIRLYKENVEEFSRLAEQTWDGLRIRSIEGGEGLPGDDLAFLIQDGDFVGEIGWMGHGLQMWLQTMWFLSRTKKDETIILDEPDVYMHADLQRKLIRLLRKRNKQTIIATHSVEIMSEVDPSNIVVIDKTESKSVFVSTLPMVQNIIDQIGSIHNIQIARLWSSKKLILVEGKDIKYLKLAQNKVYPDSNEPIDAIPNMQIGGWSGWPYVIGSRMVLKNALGQNVSAYCLLDRDYHTNEVIKKRQKKAEEQGIYLHIWEKKEIENYFLIPAAIQRYIAKNARKKVAPTLHEAEIALLKLADELKSKVFDALATELLQQNRSGGLPTANKKARQIVDDAWSNGYQRLNLISGKEMLSKVSNWSKANYGVSISLPRLISEIESSEFDAEFRRVLRAIEKGYELS